MYCVPSKMQPHNVAVKHEISSNNETKQMQTLSKQIRICFVKPFAVKSAL